MEVPDKIYLVLIEKHLEPYWVEDKQLDSDVEYIRKDAVLELLQERNKEINGTSKAFFRSQELQEIYCRINEL